MRRYRQDFKRLLAFAFTNHLLSGLDALVARRHVLTDAEIEPFLPIPGDILLLFVAFLSQSNNSQSVLQVLSGLHYFHSQAGLSWPARFSPPIRNFLRGHRRAVPIHAPGFAAAISAADLCRLHAAIAVDERLAGAPLGRLRLLWCLACWTFEGLLRLGELLVGDPATVDDSKLLRLSHVSAHSFAGRRNLVVTLPFAKHFDPSLSTAVPLKPPTVSSDPLDPIHAWDAYRRCRQDSWDYAFLDPATGAVPTRAWFNAFLARFLPGFTGASFRAGGATDLAYRGYSFPLIQRLGRWKDDTFQRYIRNNPTILLAQMYYLEDVGELDPGLQPITL
jgi:hypothetical protein